MNDDKNRGLNGNRWLEELRAEEAVAAPRPEFKSHLRNRLGAEWDGTVVRDARSGGPDTAVMPAPTTTGAAPTEIIPSDIIPSDRRTGGPRPLDRRPTELQRSGLPRRPGPSTTGDNRHGARTNVAWARLAAAAAVVGLIGGGVVLLTQRGNDNGQLVATDTTPAPTSAAPSTSAPTSTVPTPSSGPPSGTIPTSTVTTSPPTAAAETSIVTDAPGTAAPTASTPPPNPSGLTMLEAWPTVDQNSVDRSPEAYQRYLPSSPVPNETEVQYSIVDPAYWDPVYAQSYRVGDGMVMVTTKIAGMGETPGGTASPLEAGRLRLTGETINTGGWVNAWPDAQIARTPSGVTSVVLQNSDGWVTVTGVGLDRATVEQLAAGMVRRTESRPGWDLPGTSDSLSDGWQYGLAEVRVLFLANPDTPVTQLDFTDQQVGLFPFIAANASAQFVDISGRPGAVSSADGLITVSWIGGDGKVLTLLHTGSWDEAVRIARTVQPASLAEWDDRVDMPEERSGHEVDCFYLRCGWSAEQAAP